jgi:hypothetical protein
MIAKIYPDKTVEYIDARAKTDLLAQEMINEVLETIK